MASGTGATKTIPCEDEIEIEDIFSVPERTKEGYSSYFDKAYILICKTHPDDLTNAKLNIVAHGMPIHFKFETSFDKKKDSTRLCIFADDTGSITTSKFKSDGKLEGAWWFFRKIGKGYEWVMDTSVNIPPWVYKMLNLIPEPAPAPVPEPSD